MTWFEHGPDHHLRRGPWTLKVRKFADGWSPVIAHHCALVWRDTRTHDTADLAKAACLVAADILASQLRGVAEPSPGWVGKRVIWRHPDGDSTGLVVQVDHRAPRLYCTVLDDAGHEWGAVAELLEVVQ